MGVISIVTLLITLRISTVPTKQGKKPFEVPLKKALTEQAPTLPTWTFLYPETPISLNQGVFLKSL